MALGHATSSSGSRSDRDREGAGPGRVKTRLTPPCSPVQAAALACAALQDTLDAAARPRAPAAG